MVGEKLSIPKILDVSYGAVDHLDQTLHKQDLNQVLVFLGKGIKELFSDKIDKFVQTDHLQVLEVYEYENLNVGEVVKKAYGINHKEQAIVAIGGGKVVDTAKYISYLRNVPFISVPTSIANDGFCSSGASLYIDGKRKSVKAHIPYGVICDLNILKSAPDRLYYSGLGDIVSKITAMYDWEYEEKTGYGRVDHFASLIAKKSVNSVVRLPFKYLHDDLFIKEAVDSLIMSGIAMEMAGNSAPASGSEHLLSHALDQMLDQPYPHGIQVGIATYLMALVQDHRVKRVTTFLTQTGFFDYIKTLDIPRDIWYKAIDLAPSIKPNRNTFLHDEALRDKAKSLLESDIILKRILKQT